MEKKSMTALMCVFSRAYHSKENKVKIFDDTIAEKLLSDDEYNMIWRNMADGIKFFNPEFNGSRNEAVRWIVDNQLSPSPLGRSAYSEKILEKSVRNSNVTQYLIFAAGYDSFAYRQPQYGERLNIFEIDHPATASDKIKRLKKAHIDIPENVHFVDADFTKEKWIEALIQKETFDSNKISFCSIMGLSYYLSKKDFEKIIKTIRQVIPKGSLVTFDYPDEDSIKENACGRVKKQMVLAEGAGEKMSSGCSYDEMERIMDSYGFSIYEHLTPDEITEQYFSEYNKENPDHYMSAFDNVNYCTAIRR